MAENPPRCDGKAAEVCQGGHWSISKLCNDYCINGTCENATSCNGTSNTCRGESCCTALQVLGSNAVFYRDYDGVKHIDKSYTAIISTFLLDKYEVNVSRFRAFIKSYANLNLQPGDGQSAYIQGDEGWSSAFSLPKLDDLTKVPESKQYLSGCVVSTWDDADTMNDDLPINCVNWYVAYAFCIWDKARLPTEAELNYAASGGNEQRVFPWGPTLDDDSRAVYLQDFPLPVGSKPNGKGRWGQLDLSGNMAEWTLDYYSTVYPTSQCSDCLNSTPGPDGLRAVRGGSFDAFQPALEAANHTQQAALSQDAADYFVGFRCARDIPK